MDKKTDLPPDDMRLRWQPPPRPEWVQRINEEGYCMNIGGVVPLDEKSLLASAMHATGLSDFGADDWREPFHVLIKSMEDAELNLMGRIRTRSEILQLLEARLRIEDCYKHHPEIDEQQIAQPIIVVGQGRSGTSFLTNVLTADPDNKAPLQWEAIFPCPPPETASYAIDPRIEKADKLIKQWTRVTPTLNSMHEFCARVPMEDCQLTAMNFTSFSWFDALGQIASYDAYMAGLGPEPGLRYLKRVLKLLQWKNPRQHWILKDPFYIDHLGPLLQAFPDACLVWPHRDPVRALASVISLVGTMQWGRCDRPFKGGSFEFVTDPSFSAARLNAAIDRLAAGVVPAAQIHHVHYRDLVRDTPAAIEAMYRHFGLPLSEAGRRGIAAYLTANPRDARPPHKIDMPSAAMAVARQAYKRYQDHFAIPSE